MAVLTTTISPAPTTTQHAAVLALAVIVGEGLTPLAWAVRPNAHLTEALDGQIYAPRDDALTRAVAAEYAALLGAPVTETRSANGAFTKVRTAGVFQGVSVAVWGHVDRAPADAVAEVRANAAALEEQRNEMDQARAQLADVLTEAVSA